MCASQVEWHPRPAQERNGAATVVAILGLCPKVIQGTIEGDCLVPDDERRTVIELEDIEFDSTAGVPCVDMTEVRWAIGGIHVVSVHRDAGTLDGALP